MPVIRLVLALLLSVLNISAVCAHEIESNRATMVLRDPTHVSLTLYVRYSDVLYRALATGRSHEEFLLACSAMKPDDFLRQVLRAQARLQLATKAVLDGKEAAIAGWVWPDAARTQAQLRQRVMEAMVGSGAHVHEQPLEIRADITSDKEIKSVNIQFAEEFGKILVVSYRPAQVLVEEKQLSPMIKF